MREISVTNQPHRRRHVGHLCRKTSGFRSFRLYSFVSDWWVRIIHNRIDFLIYINFYQLEPFRVQSGLTRRKPRGRSPPPARLIQAVRPPGGRRARGSLQRTQTGGARFPLHHRARLQHLLGLGSRTPAGPRRARARVRVAPTSAAVTPGKAGASASQPPPEIPVPSTISPLFHPPAAVGRRVLVNCFSTLLLRHPNSCLPATAAPVRSTCQLLLESPSPPPREPILA